MTCAQLMVFNKLQRRLGVKDREVKRLDVGEKLANERDFLCRCDLCFTVLIPSFDQGLFQLRRIGQISIEASADPTRRNEIVAAWNRELLIECVPEQFADLGPHIARVERMVVILALIVIPNTL